MKTLEAEVLLAEDNLADAELILESLAGEGLADRVHLARDGEEALDFAFSRGPYAHRRSGTPPRLIMLDVKLPKVTGLEVLRQLKRDPRTRAIPVVMLTSSNIDRDVALGYRFGANSYIQKAVDFERFREAVRLLGTYWLTMNEAPPSGTFTEDDT